MTATQPTTHVEDGSRQPASRAALRQRLLAARDRFAATTDAAAAQRSLTARLAHLLHDLEPALLGMYWPVRGEFNPCGALESADHAAPALALPWAQREPRLMRYRRWDGVRPETVDECGVPAPDAGTEVVPDVVLVPCVGYTRSGWRLGYGGGYFDRWLGLHPHVTAVGVAWSASEIEPVDWDMQPHDRSLTVIITEVGVVS